MAAQGVKTYIYWSTKQCRDIVRKVLEPHPHTGLHQRTIFDEIHRQFPDLKNDTTIIPKRAMTDATNSVVGVPPHPEHPLRSRSYLKRTVLPEMLQRGEVQDILFRRRKGDPPDEQFVDTVKVKTTGETFSFTTEPTGIGLSKTTEWRWRLTPGHVPDDTPDPTPEDKFEERRLELAKATEIRKRKILAKERRKAGGDSVRRQPKQYDNWLGQGNTWSGRGQSHN